MASMLDDYIAHLWYLEGDEYTADTIKHYAAILRRMDEQIPPGLERACPDEIRAWINAPLASGERRSVKTRANYRSIAVSFYDYACDPTLRPGLQVLDFNPARQTPKVTVPPGTSVQPITTEQLRDILARAATPYRRWYLIAAYAGLRCVELARLDRRDITEANLHVRAGKGSKKRDVPTHPLIWQEVRDLPTGRVCRRVENGGRADRRYISHAGNEHLHDVLKLHDVHMHRLRKWFGTEAYEVSGHDIRAVQVLLGHARLSTTEIYVGVNNRSKTAAVAKLPNAA